MMDLLLADTVLSPEGCECLLLILKRACCVFITSLVYQTAGNTSKNAATMNRERYLEHSCVVVVFYI